MSYAKSVVKGQAGEATDEEGRRVYQMRCVVVDLGQVDLLGRQDVLDVFEMSSAAFLDEYQTHCRESYKQYLWKQVSKNEHREGRPGKCDRLEMVLQSRI